jgi:hypothetical protein
MTEAQLRERLQACESRARRTLQALDDYRAFLAQVMLALPIHDASLVIRRLDAIRALLSDEEGSR